MFASSTEVAIPEMLTTVPAQGVSMDEVSLSLHSQV